MAHSHSMGSNPYSQPQTLPSGKIAIPGTSCYDLVNIQDIVRCEGWQKYTRICLLGGKTLISSYHIGVFKEVLLPHDFYGVHKSHLVNISYINRYRKEGWLEMEDGAEVPVSRRCREAFVREVLGRFLF
ncbi:MAG: LytTR family DNA-binding domain-containing protein [Bacteroidota bacterium]